MAFVAFLGFYVACVVCVLGAEHVHSDVARDIAAIVIVGLFVIDSLALGGMYIREAITVCCCSARTSAASHGQQPLAPHDSEQGKPEYNPMLPPVPVAEPVLKPPVLLEQAPAQPVVVVATTPGVLKLTCSEAAAALRGRYRALRLSQAGWPPGFVYGLHFEESHRAEQPWPGDAFVAHWGRPEPWYALSRRRRHRLLCLAAACHHEDSLGAALEYSGVDLGAEVMEAAAAAGDLSSAQRLVREGCECSSKALAAAARGGHLPILEWIRSNGDAPRLHLRSAFDWSRNAIAAAACTGGHQQVLSWLEQGMPMPAQAQAEAEAGLAQTDFPAAAAGGGTAADFVASQWDGGDPLRKLLAEAAGPLVGARMFDYDVTGMVSDLWEAAAKHLADYVQRWRWLAAAAALPPRWQLIAAKWAALDSHAAALAELLDEWEAMADMPPLATLAPELRMSIGYMSMEVLRVLQQRSVLPSSCTFSSSDVVTCTHMDVVAWLAAREDLEEPGSAECVAARWARIFRGVAAAGADTTLLRLLHERRGAAIDLAAVAEGGSEEAMEWAVGALRAQEAVVTLTAEQLLAVTDGGNLAIAAWLLDRGLVTWPRRQAAAEVAGGGGGANASGSSAPAAAGVPGGGGGESGAGGGGADGSDGGGGDSSAPPSPAGSGTTSGSAPPSPLKVTACFRLYHMYRPGSWRRLMDSPQPSSQSAGAAADSAAGEAAPAAGAVGEAGGGAAAAAQAAGGSSNDEGANSSDGSGNVPMVTLDQLDSYEELWEFIHSDDIARRWQVQPHQVKWSDIENGVESEEAGWD
ncbi:hypothetical protein HXX76_007466 [Chlamydomonas incerta]|uniref:Uncharacterized protein n=1 Tax=Chlamydomonas incerta TaxID=51695 RepID=A0A835T7U4_CHLIN|nr:hypothetical protein HXX76_007466 [Chlamydomonas incerta]|eukprot:KAG2435394.1 hypothetical protein HXX76_007466 [Chlamydomonas incerta]